MVGDKDSDEKPKLKRKEYEKELCRLQAELCQLQDWVKLKGLRVVVVFDGRDGAGKGGTIRREKVKLPKRSNKGAYDNQATLKGRNFVPEKC